MTLADRLGWAQEQIGLIEGLKGIPAPEEMDACAGPELRCWCPFSHHLVALSYYLLGHELDARHHASSVVRYTQDYFFGQWRMQLPTPHGAPDANWWQRRMPWISRYRESVFWAACLGDWRSVADLSRYPSADSRVDIGYRNADKDFYVALAAYLRNDPPRQVIAHLDRVEQGTKKLPRLLGAILRAVLSDDAGEFGRALHVYLRYFKERLFSRYDIGNALSMEGSLFFHLAARKDVRVCVGEPYQDYIVAFVA